LQSLLLHRLRIFTSIIAASVAVYWFLVFPSHPLWNRAGPQDWSAAVDPLLTLGVPWAVAALAALVLWLRPPASPVGLRAIELLVTGLLVAGFLRITLSTYETLAQAVDDPSRGSVNVSTERFALRWVYVVIAYGTLIPNTWRRCLAVVGVIWVSPLVLVAVLSLWGRPLPADVALQVLGGLAFWVGVAVAIVVFTSYRIEFLGRQADEARRLGQYVLKERLGAGGMGEVYLAVHVLLRRPCALKLVRPERAGDPRHLSRFELEVRTTATLTHTNTVQVFDYGHTEDGTFYYVMEYLPGLTLGELVKRHGPLPAGRAIHFLRQLCGALGEAHAIGLIHRDIKPSNVIVCQRGGVDDTAKLLDFGLVLPPTGGPDDEKLTQEGAIPGTPAYMSPEQAGGEENVDARSDLYSVGALAYFLLTGQPPFADRSPARVLAAHLYEPPVPLTQHRPEVPGDLQAVVMRCLAKEPIERFADAESLEAALANCHSCGEWSSKEAARWWRGQADAKGSG
jgi:serine/threonine-protein kinase